MLKLTKRYRTEYTGEEIVTSRVHEDQEWTSTTEAVPNAVLNYQISNQAVVIGNGPSRLDFDLMHITRHQGGMRGETKLQTYGCNALFRDYRSDFLVVTSDAIANELSSHWYTNQNIVYAHSTTVLTYPKKFYLIPHDPYADAGTTAAYIACFDGHKKIFLIGFDGQDSPGYNYNVYAGTDGYDSLTTTVQSLMWIQNMATLASTYDDVDFVWVTQFGGNPLPEVWKYCVNIRQISFRDLVIETGL